MRHRPLLLLAAGAFHLAGLAQCPPGAVYITSQAEADAFATAYPACTALPGNLTITGPGITDLAPFSNLTHVGGQLWLTDLSLSAIDGFHALSTVGELRIAQCTALTSISGFTTLDSVALALIIWQNNALSMLNGFPDLEVCGASLFMSENATLTSIGGFGELDSVFTLAFSFNPMLTNISAFDHAIAISSLEMFNNNALSPCNVQAICDYVLDADNSSYLIAGNALGCQSHAEVYASCTSTAVDDQAPAHPALITNPVTEILGFAGPGSKSAAVAISDPQGRIVFAGRMTDGSIDVRGLRPGPYVLQLITERGSLVFRFVRE